MLEFSGLNYWAIIVAWLVNVVVGGIWYSPIGFSKLWSKLSGVDMMKLPKKEANRAVGFVALSALIQSVTMAVVINSFGASTLIEGLQIGLLVWFGFTAVTTIGNTLYARLGFKFWWLTASYFLIVMSINSILFAVW